MSERYTYELLPLDTPDDDQCWAAYLDVVRQGFLMSRASDEGLTIYREHRRTDRARMGMMTTEGPGLTGRQPVAIFSAAPTTINCGAQLVDALMVNTIAVRSSHRRNGLLRRMMREQLDQARADSMALATLTVSEATIYARFGFGPSLRSLTAEIDTRRFHLHPGATVAPGTIEFVDPAQLAEHMPRIWGAHHDRYRGSVGLAHSHVLIDTGRWDTESGTPSTTLRAALHFDESGSPDGYAVFRHKGWDSTPITTEVLRVVSPDPAIDRALWQALVNIDLVERLTYQLFTPEDPLPLSLLDTWACKFTRVEDWTWLRILDLPSATAQRRFDADGSVVVHVRDEMGYTDGVWRLQARDGEGAAEPTDATPEISLATDVLAQLWHGDRRATDLARAGLIQGAPQAIARLGELMSTIEAPVNVATY